MKIRLAGILPNSNSNGPGLRKVFFSQGCSKHCDGCFNQHTWSFEGGKWCDCDELIKETLEETYLAGITFSGGDPFEQAQPFAYLAQNFRKHHINVWSYSGYTYQEILNLAKKDENVKTLLENIDVLVDGRFDKHLTKEKILYRGSSNQKIIDVQKSLKSKKVVLWKTANEEL